MRFLRFDAEKGGPFRILCLGAHSDDIEIGCGATVLTLVSSTPNVEVVWVVFSASGEREGEARAAAEVVLDGAAESDVEVLAFPDGFFPYQGATVKEKFEELKGRVSPDLIFTHWEGDRHQDHRLISELTWNTFRDHLILEYEVPKYDGDLGNPNVFFPVSEEARNRKIQLLMDKFQTQRSKAWFSPETFLGIMRIRGVESASPTGYAEGFHSRKLLLIPKASPAGA